MVNKEGLGTSSTSKKNPNVLFSVTAALNLRELMKAKTRDWSKCKNP